MKLNRRQFLRGAGGVTVLLVGGGVFRAVDQGVFAAGTGPAYEEWTDWQTETLEGPLRLVQSAILAANPHNSQPWLFRVNDDAIDLYADTGRHLGAMDPYLREMHIGLGCAIENMLVTAAATGYDVQLQLEEGKLATPGTTLQMEKAATLALTAGTPTPNALYDAIPTRHTNRYNYDNARSLSDELTTEMAEIAAADPRVRLFAYRKGTPAFLQLADATVTSTEAIIADHEMAHDSYVWIDQSWQEVQQEKDGPYIDTAGVPPYLRGFVKMLPSTSQQQIDSGWLSSTEAAMKNTDILGFLSVPDLYEKADALRAGRIWQHMHLWATSQGLAMQPINQMPEIVDRDRQLGQESSTALVMDAITGDPAWRPTFAFRLGYPVNSVLPSARRPVEEVLLA